MGIQPHAALARLFLQGIGGVNLDAGQIGKAVDRQPAAGAGRADGVPEGAIRTEDEIVIHPAADVELRMAPAERLADRLSAAEVEGRPP